MEIEAIYEHGVLRPLRPLELPQGERVGITVVTYTEAVGRYQAKAERDAREIEIINANIDALSEEAWDALSYQVES
jgi:predicted DNA-binding antitoxin AbrB/MazE fold protein